MRTGTLLLAAIAFPLVALSQSSQLSGAAPSATAAQKPPPALQTALKHGFRIVRSFQAVSGLTGWVLHEPNGEYTLVYTTADQQTVLVGQLLNSSGEELSAQYAEKYLPGPDLKLLWTKLDGASLIVAGKGTAPKSVIYVVMDPNCIYCHMLWIALKPYEAAGLQVRWIPVGFLQESSAAKAAALLQGGNAALEQCQSHFDVKNESGGIAGISITSGLKTKLDSNLQLMRQGGVQGTPGIFYKDKAGHVRRQDGMPSLSQLPTITSLPAQPERDPQLAPFS